MKYSVERKVWDIIWGFVFEDFTHYFEEYENDTFHVRPYCWEDDDEEDKNEWHFWHKPSGFKMYWYKYPLRSAKYNMDISDAQFVDVLHDCYNSMQDNSFIKITHYVDKWWEDEQKL